MTDERYPYGRLHRLLLERHDQNRPADSRVGSQAGACPYFVRLEGAAGNDWGVVLNPESTRFAVLTFEHGDCGCPPSADEDEDGYGRHTDEDVPEHLL